MNPGLRTSASGMAAQQKMVDVIAHNLANVNTTAFKRSRVSFEDVLYETIKGQDVLNYQGSETTAPIQIGQGVKIAGVMRLHTQGSTDQTGRQLDVAISGEGFFQLTRADGQVGYTRDGTFTLSDTGQIVTQDGYLLQPSISIPADASQVNISPNGTVSILAGNSSTPVEVGRIELAKFLNPTGLLAVGENTYMTTPASGAPILGAPQAEGFGSLLQGYLESSNVEIVTEMTDMIAAQRAYEINAKAVRANDEMMQSTNELIR